MPTIAHVSPKQRLLLLPLFALLAACQSSSDGNTDPEELRRSLQNAEVPAEHLGGQEGFLENCAACHGELALGTEQGPPLVHRVYRPAHHADAAFLLAITRGVRAHHWGFGDMPPVPGVTRAEAEEIVAYIRWLQLRAGI